MASIGSILHHDSGIERGIRNVSLVNIEKDRQRLENKSRGAIPSHLMWDTAQRYRMSAITSAPRTRLWLASGWGMSESASFHRVRLRTIITSAHHLLSLTAYLPLLVISRYLGLSRNLANS